MISSLRSQLSILLVLAACVDADHGAVQEADEPASEGSRAAPADTRRASLPEHRVTSGDTALQRMARDLLPAIERASGLSSSRPVQLAIREREELESYLEEQLEKTLPEDRASRIADTYQRLGLFPDSLDLRAFLRELYMEQVAGYYDPAVDTLFLMEGASDDRLRTVLVHELVHALQDQRVDLDSLTEALRRENDRGAAFQAAVEGHATYVMTELRLGQMMGREVDLTSMQGLVERIRSSTAVQGEGMPVFASAPRIIRETLTFPYLEGMGFVQRLWSSRAGRPPPLDSLLPLSTEQVIHPGKLAGADRDPPTRVTAPPPPPGWSERHADALGELEFRILLEEHLSDEDRARRLAAGWDGDLVVLAEDDRDQEALLWIAVWDGEGGADSAATGLREAMAGRYGSGSMRDVEVVRRTFDGRPGLLMLDLPAGRPGEPWLRYADDVVLEEPSR